jgi:uncharacterized protein
MAGETDWKENLIEDSRAAQQLIADAKRIAVLGIKPQEESHKAAFYVPDYLQKAGKDIVPVPVYFPEMNVMLGEKVYRKVADVPGDVDMVIVFRRPKDIPAHVDDIIKKKPGSVWFQQGIRNAAAADAFAQAGIKVVEDRCSMVEHRRALS